MEAISRQGTVKHQIRRELLGWRTFLVCMTAPVAGALVRKLLPAQPAAAEVLAVVPILIMLPAVLRKERSLPDWIALPLLYWALFQLAYVPFSIRDDWRVGVAAIFTRLVPMLMAVIAFSTIRTWDDFRRASKWIASLAPLLLPVGLIVAIWGNGILPAWLSPIRDVTLGGRDLRSGLSSPAGVFTTPWILSWSMLAVLFISLANIVIDESEGRSTARWWLATVSALLLLYFSIRRGALFGGFVGLAFYFLLNRRAIFTKRTMALTLVVATVVLLVDRFGYNVSNELESRSDIILILRDINPTARLDEVFLPIFRSWIVDSPLGNYLGFAGPEARGLGVSTFQRFYSVVEVGGAQLVAELGIMGAFLMPLVLALVAWQILKRSRGLRHRRAIGMLLLFQLVIFVSYYTKELLALSNISIAQFFFWAVPGICAALIQQELSEERLE